MLFRFRRYRVFLIFAFILAFTLVRLSRNRDWGSTSKIVLNGHPQNPEHGSKNDHLTPVQQKPNEYLPPSSDKGRPVVDSQKSSPKPILLPSSSVVAKQALPSSELQPSHSAVKETPQTESTPTPTIPDTILPDRRPISQPLPHNDDEIEELHAESPGKVEPVIFNPYPTPIHWERQKEHFPVPLESLIKLPTGAPKPMPKIQFKFADESTDAKIKREARQSRVKEEFKLAWSGYKAKAWRHDEIRPVSGTFRDPFAGWAATLVDSLDTLWIMGLKEEFDEAVKAVETIDFTTSTRNDIQMFEVTIRYLGGMLAAYDVSGGKYKILLSKAVELADIMMGAFDTPNRMPVLYYNWKPVFASQPHRASARASLAELGSLSMEFTRLAQLTHEDKYYDAVARITNALEEYQNRGTRIEGVFPDNVDATGCNHTATTAKNLAVMPAAKGLDSNMEPIVAEGYQAPMPDTVAEPRPNKVAGAETLQFEIIPGQPSKGHIEKLDDPIQKPRTISQRVTKREVADNVATNTSTTVQSSNITSPSTTTPNDISPRLPGGTVTLQDWDCVKQGLDSPAGVQSFSMGGGQDSTYEYFTKQYLLLGGLEDKYRTMYLKTMKGVRKNLLYRPMVPDNRDILFSGKASTWLGSVSQTFEAEVTHLTCFIGGMVGMGAKLFDIPTDIEIAKKLSDGCVWAYESTPSGIMPEYAHVLACESIKDCPWNETLWREALDPMTAAQRAKQIAIYEDQKVIQAAQKEEERQALEAKAIIEAELAAAKATAAPEAEEERPPTGDSQPEEKTTPEMRTDVDSKAPSSTRYEDSLVEAVPAAESAKSFKKRDVILDANETLKPTALGNKEITSATPETKKALPSVDPVQQRLQEKLAVLQLELKKLSKPHHPETDVIDPVNSIETNNTFTPTPTEQVPINRVSNPEVVDVGRPQTHDEFVEEKIKTQNIPTGYIKINSDQYILRPEAIESVWYMYRITGEDIWLEKGWMMFEAIIKATSTTYGHSAIRFITKPKPELVDEMESFWLAETLKYFYLLFSTPETISLDEWVLNTEAHPFKRPIPSG